MLSNVSEAINKASRNITLRHPNGYSATVIRKVVDRVSSNSVGGAPTLGGMAVISSDDEEDVSWHLLGNAYVLEVDAFSTSIMMDRIDANNGFADESRFLIEPEVLGVFTLKKHDVINTLKNGLVRLAFEIVEVETIGNIPPYTLRYVCNRRNDLDFVV